MSAARQAKLELSAKIQSFNSIAGHGVEAKVDNKDVLIGTEKLMRDRKVDNTELDIVKAELLDSGKTIMIIAVNKSLAGIIAVQDPVKPTAQKTIDRMKELGFEVAMITGDNKKTAKAIGKQLGIERVFAEVLPEDKVSYVKSCRTKANLQSCSVMA